MSPSTVEGQVRPTGTITLTAAAPSGGASVSLSSNNTDAAKVPANVSVPAGSTSTTFVVDTSSVVTSQTVTITGTYSGVTKTTTLTVTPQALRAAFSVTGGVRGTDTCSITGENGPVDCRYDGGSSRGPVRTWIWTTVVGAKEASHESNDAVSAADSGCSLLSGGTPVTVDGRPQYVNIQVKLQVQETTSNKSEVVTRTIRLYPNSRCDYGF